MRNFKAQFLFKLISRDFVDLPYAMRKPVQQLITLHSTLQSRLPCHRPDQTKDSDHGPTFYKPHIGSVRHQAGQHTPIPGGGIHLGIGNIWSLKDFANLALAISSGVKKSAPVLAVSGCWSYEDHVMRFHRSNVTPRPHRGSEALLCALE